MKRFQILQVIAGSGAAWALFGLVTVWGFGKQFALPKLDSQDLVFMMFSFTIPTLISEVSILSTQIKTGQKPSLTENQRLLYCVVGGALLAGATIVFGV